MYYHIKKTPVITRIREGKQFTRSIAAFVIAVFSFVTYSPAALAVANSKDPQHTKSAREHYDVEKNFDQLEILLTRLNASLKKADNKDVDRLRPWSSVTASLSGNEVEQDRVQLRAVWKQVEKSQRAKLDTANVTLQRLSKKLPAAKREKRQQQLTQVSLHIDTMHKYMEGIDDADSVHELKRQTYAALKHLIDTRPKAPTHVFDSDQMPFGVDSDATRTPYTTAEELHKYLGLEYDPNFDPEKEGINLVTDFSATTDVQITDDVKALAKELNNSPTAIYNWVYNNIHFVPSFGSIQGSDLTLANRQGNAFDISSLLIALLRTSNVPARYVYGTVVMSADQMKNWVGGVDDVESARVLLAQGGVPTSAISDGGRYERIRFEHVWVEAYGLFNENNKLRWNALDAGFKQYTYTEGVDLLEEVGFDKQAFTNVLKNSGQSDASNNWVSNVDTTAVQEEMRKYQEALSDYLASQPADTTLSEIIGGQSIITRGDMETPGPLPYQSYVRTRSFAVLPDNVRHYFYVDLATGGGVGLGGLGGLLGGGSSRGSTFMSYKASLPELAGKQLSLSFKPASEADEAIVQSLLSNVQSEADLPSSIDAGLFDVVAEITVDGDVVANSGSKIIGFGDQLTTNKGFIDPRFGYRETTSPITAGDYQAIGLDWQGVTAKQLQAIATKIENLKGKLKENKFDGLTRHGLVGDILHAGVLSYFSMNDAMISLAAKMNGLVHYRMPSFGTFSTYAQVELAWSSGTQVNLGAVVMDVDWLMSNNEGKVNCWQDWVAFNQLSGLLASTYEHIIPEQFFAEEANSFEAVSTVKALAIANSEGQRIYQVTSENANYLLPLIDADSEVKNDIKAAIAGGDVAIIHENPIDYRGYVGSGYILLDPETGSGAYKITGGGNGALLVAGLGVAILFIFGMLITSGLVAVEMLTTIIGVIIAGLAVISATFIYVALFAKCPITLGNYADGGEWMSNAFDALQALAMTLVSALAGPIGALTGIYLILDHLKDLINVFSEPPGECGA